jgi:hypothetical protein
MTPPRANPSEPVTRSAPKHARIPDAASGAAQGNERLTASMAAVIFVLLFFEGLTILSIHSLLHWHVFIGLLLVPPILAKIVSTSWRFARYYLGSPTYRRRGPPAPALRVLGPVLVVLTVAVFATGILLVVGAPVSMRPALLQWHQLAFVAWFGVTAVHVLGHLVETMTVAPRDWLARTRRQVRGASTRQWAVAVSLSLGVVTALWVTPYATGWRF